MLVTDAGNVLMLRGEPRRAGDIARVLSGLRSGEIRFQERRLGGTDPVPTLGAVLWREAHRAADGSTLGPGIALSPTSGARKASLFPLSQAAMDFLKVGGEVGELIRLQFGEREDVKRELAALVVLGLFRTIDTNNPEAVERAWLRRELLRIQQVPPEDLLGVIGVGPGCLDAEAAQVARDKVGRCLALQSSEDEKIRRTALRVGGAMVAATKALFGD